MNHTDSYNSYEKLWLRTLLSTYAEKCIEYKSPLYVQIIVVTQYFINVGL